jgi:hypothetical protein
MVGILSPKDESLVRGIREGLAKIAAAVATGADDSNLSAVQTALDGSEMVVRGELMSGREDHLPRLMPSFVFLAVLPTVGQDRALALSKRASELIRHGLEERG